MGTCPPIIVLIANSPIVRDFRDERPDTICPKDDTKNHCHCSADEHSCGFCGQSW